MIHILYFKKLGGYNFKINVIPKTIEKYKSFNKEQNKVVTVDCGLYSLYR